jgi:SAM-dependent methyltransferase
MKQFIKNLVDRFLVDRIAQRTAQQLSTELAEIRTETCNAVNLFRLSGLLDSAPDGVPPTRLFATIDDDFWLWLHTEGYRRSDAVRRILPGFPPEETQYQYVGTVGDAAMKMGLAASRVFKKIYEQTRGRALTPETSVLDFGCGWGRIFRFFLKDIDPARLHGTDVSEEMVTFCRQEFRWGTFHRNDPFPPTKFGDGTFDLIYALSVFSHLSEDAHRKWLAEFKRILVPGGVLIATTWGREFITRCRDSRGRTDLTSTTRHLPGLFVDTNESLSRYDNGLFCFDSSREGYGEFSEWLGETCISKRYVMSQWPAFFEHLDYVDEGADRHVFRQNIIVGQTASA